MILHFGNFNKEGQLIGKTRLVIKGEIPEKTKREIIKRYAAKGMIQISSRQYKNGKIYIPRWKYILLKIIGRIK